MSQQKRGDWVRLAQSPTQIERIEAFFGGHGYEPHRHDTYAIGQTLSGVQRFHYRGGLQHNLPGGTMVLHPDEVHDGDAGTEEGFRYRMVYIEPSLIQKILGGKPLPFIPGGISSDPRLLRAALPLLKDVNDVFAPSRRRTRFTIWRRLWPLSVGCVIGVGLLTIPPQRRRESISMPVLRRRSRLIRCQT
ncbi:hypothetical protein SB6411_04205 [Klebsiella spallanzanii]|uniref:AraC-type arabinose-binding/dimerisation domain-containing protein n=1 Tax=Klebsiella spallanzanii TaxID=2587528 RepID=A0ABY6VKQ3_9ENTR|nr:hypothetical protein SB6411_04205 [Klebsiella spallanzanii]